MTHVAPYKKQLVEDLAARCAAARVVGVANIHGIPAPQFQAIRKKLSGPVVGELQKAGIPAAIERGKVVIRQDKLLVKTGQRIPRDVAQQLARLEIFPLVVGLDLRGAYEAGTVFRREALAIDDAIVRGQIGQAGRQAFALALEIAYVTRETIGPLLAKAHAQALGLAVESEVPTKESIKFLLAKAQAQMLALAARVPSTAGEGDPQNRRRHECNMCTERWSCTRPASR